MGECTPRLRHASPSNSDGYGTLIVVTTDDGSVPARHPWPAAVRGTIVGFSILVRSTTARELAPPLASTAIASPPFGLLYAVTVCGSNPFEKPLMLQLTQ